ncbi:MAG: 50S ribosomal protein L11 methyltransferase [Patescibacteria group bacterium]
MIELQQKLLGDKIRNEAFYEVLKIVIKKGESVVADVGSGTGFLSFLASRLGAKECHLYEYSNVGEIGEKLALANKIINCHFIQKHSVEVKNPPKADVIISETLGNYALEENIIESIEDSKRFLKPGGVIIPQKIEQFIAPVTSPRIFDEMNVWDSVGYDLDFGIAREAALNNMYVYKILPKDLMDGGKSAVVWDKIDFSKQEKSVRKGSAKWRIEKDCTIYGLAVWWNANLIRGINISTSPLAPATHWDQIFLPLTAPISAKKGQILEVSLKSDSRFEVGINLSWTVRLLDQKAKILQNIAMDMKKGAY